MTSNRWNLATPDHPVVRELALRMREGSEGSSASKLGLVVEGGGMRGVISGGALVALEEYGLTAIFDEVHAESAGAMNACYFLAGQAALGGRIYTEDLTGRRFVRPWRLNKILDIDFLTDEVMASVKRLDCGRVERSRTKLLVSVTNAGDGSSRIIQVGRCRAPLLRILKATAAIIPLFNYPVELDGGMYVDGGIADPIPVRNAIASGCTHILVLLTRPLEFEAAPLRGLPAVVARVLLGRKWDPRLISAFFQVRHRRYNESRALAFGITDPGSRVEIAIICPDGGTPAVTRMSRSVTRLNGAMAWGKDRVRELLGKA